MGYRLEKQKGTGSSDRAANAPKKRRNDKGPLRVCFRLVAGAAECNQPDNDLYGWDAVVLTASAACYGVLNGRIMATIRETRTVVNRFCG